MGPEHAFQIFLETRALDGMNDYDLTQLVPLSFIKKKSLNGLCYSVENKMDKVWIYILMELLFFSCFF